MIALQTPEPAIVSGRETRNRASWSWKKTYSFSYNHVSLGIITIRNATFDDLPAIREKMYEPFHVHAGKAFELFDPRSEQSYARVGGIFDLPSEQELNGIIDHGVILMATCVNDDREEIIAVLSGYDIDMYNDICDICNRDAGSGEMIRIDCLPSFDGIESFDGRPLILNRKIMRNVLDDTGRKRGAILIVRDVIVDQRYREMDILEFIMYKVVRVLKCLYNCSYFFSEIHDVNRIVVNGATLLDENGKPVTMKNIESKIDHKEIMKGVEVGYKESFMKRVGSGNHRVTGHPVHDRIDVEIHSTQWISSSEKILNTVSLSNKRNARIHVPDFVQ